jgi:hypothetical protein
LHLNSSFLQNYSPQNRVFKVYMPPYAQLLAAVYQHTALGQRAVLGTGSRLRSDLSTILQTIDGKRTTQTLVARFGFMGDVPAMLAELEDMHLIERPAATEQPSVDQIATTQSFLDTQAAFEETHVATLPAELHDMPYHDALGMEDSPALALQRVRIREVCDLMGNFIIAHLPASAFEELADLERINSTGHLMAYLSHYQELIADLPQESGAQMAKHLADLDMRVEELLGPA